MLKGYTSRQKLVLISLIAILIISTSLITLLKPYYFYKQPLKLFGYVSYNTTLNEGYAYTTTNKGFYVSNIQDDGEILDSYLFKTNIVCYGVKVIDGDLFVGFENGDLVRYDISDPINIVEISSKSLNEAILSITSKESSIYVSTAEGSVFSIDLTNETILDSYSVSSEYIRDIQIYGNYLMYASTSSGVGILDISDPSSLEFVKNINGTSSSFDINIYDDKLFVSRHQYGLTIFEISDELDFTLMQNINVSGEVYSSAFNGTYLIIGDLQEGIEKWRYDVMDDTFVYLHTFEEAVPHHLYIFDNLIITADQDRGLFIIKLEDEG
jgi:hypothetical protein